MRANLAQENLCARDATARDDLFKNHDFISMKSFELIVPRTSFCFEHLAAANNQDDAAQYLLTQLGHDIMHIRDRWGNTAIDDSKPGSFLQSAAEVPQCFFEAQHLVFFMKIEKR